MNLREMLRSPHFWFGFLDGAFLAGMITSAALMIFGLYLLPPDKLEPVFLSGGIWLGLAIGYLRDKAAQEIKQKEEVQGYSMSGLHLFRGMGLKRWILWLFRRAQ